MRKALFIDTGNIHNALLRTYDRRLSYKFLLDSLGKLQHKHAYGMLQNEFSVKFADALKYLGFNNKFIEQRKHFSWDVEITLDVVRIADRIDEVIICSNKKELLPLYIWMREKGLLITAIGCYLPREVRAIATSFIELNEDYLEAVSNETIATA